VEREFGCGGGAIAEKLANRLGWELWDQLLTNEIARKAKCKQTEVELREERLDPMYYRLLKSVLRGSFEGSLNVNRLQLLDADSIFQITGEIVQKAASIGNCVIVGRGSQHFLQDREDTLRVFLYASKEAKVKRLIADGVSESEAQDAAERVDSERAAFIGKYFHMDWPNRLLYHAMLSTDSGDETVLEAILCLKSTIGRLNQPAGR
jgi:cytidylate kinase